MYENDSVRDIRPKGLNVMELHLWICYFTKNYHLDRVKTPTLDYNQYIQNNLTTVWKPVSIADFQIIAQGEINSLHKLGFIDNNNELTEKGITFVTIALNGSYAPLSVKFENLVNTYMMALSMPSQMISFMPMLDDHMHEEPAYSDEEKPDLSKMIAADDKFVTVDIPKEAFLEMMETYAKKNRWETFKSLFK